MSETPNINPLKIIGNVLNKFDGTQAPSPTDDSTQGYAVGSVWVDVTNDKAYTCVDSTATSAVWNAAGGGGNTIYSANDTIGTGRVATLTDTLNFFEGNFNLFGLDKDKKVAYVSGDSVFGNQLTYVSDALNFKYDNNTGTGQIWAINNSASTGKLHLKGAEVHIENPVIKNDLRVSGNSTAANATRAIEIPFGTSGTWRGVNMLATQKSGGGADFEIQVSPSGLSGTYETVIKILKNKNISLLSSTTIQGDGTGTGTTLALYDNDTTPSKTWEWLDNGNINLGVNSVVGIGANDLTFEGSGIFKLSNGAKSIYSNWATHTTLVLDNGNGVAYRFYSANASTAFNSGEFGIGGSGSNIPFRIFNTSSVALGSVGKGSLDTNYNVQTAGATLIGGNLDTKSGTNEISLDHTNYPKLKISNGTNEYWLIEGDGTGATFDTGDLYLYDQTNSQKILQFKQSNDSLLFSVNLDMNNNRISNTIVNPSVQETTSTATFTINADQQSDGVLTAMSASTTIAAPTGTPVQSQDLVFRFKDDGTARSLTWNAIFRAIGVTLPTTTVASKLTYVGCKYNSTDSKWDVVAVQQEA